MFEESRNLRPADEWTFYCALGESGRHDERVRNLGGRIIYSPVPFCRTVSFLWALRQTLKKEHCDVLHCHHDLLSGFYLLAATGLPIRQRIVHVHNTDEALPTPNKLKQWVFAGTLAHNLPWLVCQGRGDIETHATDLPAWARAAQRPR